MKKMFANFQVQTNTVQDAVNEFLSIKRGKKAEETVKYYDYRLAKFNSYLVEQEGIVELIDISRAVIDRYMSHVKAGNKQVSNQTLNNYLRAIRTFLNYCTEEGYMPRIKIELYPSTNTPKPSYSQDEQKALLQKPDLNKCTFVEYRNWVIVCHFLASGNRSKTVRNIQIKHVDLERRRIVLETTKNNEALYMPISDTYYPILREYLKVRKGEADDFLFCNQFGKQLTAGGLRCIMRKYNQGKGVDTTSIHRYRNTFAETWIMNDGNPKKLQYALGHKTQHMVDEYVSMYGKELTEEYNDFTPLSQQREQLESKKKVRMR